MRKKIIHWLILPCSKVTCEIEKQQAGEASLLQKWQIALHLSICKFCNAYNKKMMMLDKTMQKIIKDDYEFEPKFFDNQEFKDRLKERLKK